MSHNRFNLNFVFLTKIYNNTYPRKSKFKFTSVLDTTLATRATTYPHVASVRTDRPSLTVHPTPDTKTEF